MLAMFLFTYVVSTLLSRTDKLQKEVLSILFFQLKLSQAIVFHATLIYFVIKLTLAELTE